jgi:cytochrome oxidase Cu insertion factor (SCO1/SenC/PrrC family)
MKNIILALLTGAALMGQEIPRPAAPFSLTLPDGRAVSLSDYKGKVVLLAGLLTT